MRHFALQLLQISSATAPQHRRLRAHKRSGIYLHALLVAPAAAPFFNAYSSWLDYKLCCCQRYRYVGQLIAYERRRRRQRHCHRCRLSVGQLSQVLLLLLPLLMLRSVLYALVRILAFVSLRQDILISKRKKCIYCIHVVAVTRTLTLNFWFLGDIGNIFRALT